MKKYMNGVMILLVILTLSGCEDIFDSFYQSIEIDSFVLVDDDKKEIVIDSEIPDFKEYINRVTKEGTIVSKDKFDVDAKDFDISTVGEYKIIYSFVSLDEVVEYELTVFVVEELED